MCVCLQAQKPWGKRLQKVLAARKEYHTACRTEKSTANQENNARGDASVSPDSVSHYSFFFLTLLASSDTSQIVVVVVTVCESSYFFLPFFFCFFFFLFCGKVDRILHSCCYRLDYHVIIIVSVISTKLHMNPANNGTMRSTVLSFKM